MSAVIAAEFSSTEGRGSLLAAVFLAQAIGRLLAYGLGLGVLHGLWNGVSVPNSGESHVVMDKFWRLVLGLAGIPAIFAIVLRLLIPETPRFYSAVKRDLMKAREAVMKVGSRSPSLTGDLESVNSDVEESEQEEVAPWRSRAYVYFFGTTQGWKPLLSISIQWLLLDIVFYGTGFDSPGTLAALWLDKPIDSTIDYKEAFQGFDIWKQDYGFPDANIFQTMRNNLIRTLQLSSVAAVAGSLAVIPLVNYVSRKAHFVWTTGILTILFAVTAVSVSQTYARPSHVVSMVFYALTQFMFNLGPNTLTFILAAEAFPTEFRGTCYGIAAAAGKLGAIIVRPITQEAGKEKESIVALLSAFSGVLLLMTLLAWFEPWGIGIPRVQERKQKDTGGGLIPTRLVNLSLEEAAPWPVLDESDSVSGHDNAHSHNEPERPREKVVDGTPQGGVADRAMSEGNMDIEPSFRLSDPQWTVGR